MSVRLCVCVSVGECDGTFDSCGCSRDEKCDSVELRFVYCHGEAGGRWRSLEDGF